MKSLSALRRQDILETTTYPAFREKLEKSNCAECPLFAGRTQIVVDRGNADSRVLFIGEAPGENEDLQGKAFVGRAGRLLDTMLTKLGFDTNQDALIANVAKCRPPGNRAPHPEEAQACLPYLRKQIELMNPEIIALLGATALKHFLPEKRKFSMTAEAGRYFEHPDYPGKRIIVLFHPAYILRDPRKKPLMEEHLKQFVEVWRHPLLQLAEKRGQQ